MKIANTVGALLGEVARQAGNWQHTLRWRRNEKPSLRGQQRRGKTLQGTEKIPRLESGEAIPWWGEDLRLEVSEQDGLRKNRAVARIVGRTLVLQIEAGADEQRRQQVIDRLRRASLQTRLEPLLAKWSAKYQVSYGVVQLRRMKSRWASCQVETGKLCFNLALTERDPKYLNYVVAHEFAHFFHANHGPEFHALLSLHLPEERILRRELNGRS